MQIKNFAYKKYIFSLQVSFNKEVRNEGRTHSQRDKQRKLIITQVTVCVDLDTKAAGKCSVKFILKTSVVHK